MLRRGWMLRTKLFCGFALLVVASSMLFILIGVRALGVRITDEAQNRVRLDLRSAWAEVNNRLGAIETALWTVADSPSLPEACELGDWGNPELRLRFERVRVREGLDFLELVSPEGVVMMRSAPPDDVGDTRLAHATVATAMRGEAATAMTVLGEDELQRMGVGLAERAFFDLQDTPGSRHAHKEVERRGMAMVGAVPVERGSRLLGIVYGGVLVNRNHDLVDRIHDVVYQDETYEGESLGTAEICLGDSRIATTVRSGDGTRALGTRVSKEVAGRVLDSGLPWIDKALVVDKWRLAAYEPIEDGSGRIIGMLYVGILKSPYEHAAQSVVWEFVLPSLFVLLIALGMAFYTAGRLAHPIRRLVAASNQMRRGEHPGPVPTDSASKETEELIVAFNEMAASLTEREQSLKVLNRSYMETLGFVSHELRSPVSTIMNYGYLLKNDSLGEMNEKQLKAVDRIESGGKRLVEMVRHYLNLSRIENDDMQTVPTKVRVKRDVLGPLVSSIEPDCEARGLELSVEVDDDIVLRADLNQVQEVFENLIGNAVKYGRDEGLIRVTAEPVNGFVEFTVWNEGDGFPRDKVNDLFQKFVRLHDQENVSKQKGTGLGLFISKHIVEAHGGRIEASSEHGEWAAFTFTLPRWEAALQNGQALSGTGPRAGDPAKRGGAT